MTRGRRALGRRLDAALRSDALDVHVQPLVELHANRPVAVEALARWHDDELGQVPPSEFIPLAERTGRIWELGRQVLQRAADAIAGWDGCALTVDVNVSPRQLREERFVPMVSEVIERSGVDPALLCLEVTETAAVEDLPLTRRRLAALRQLGVTVALDDFGTGYSSMTVLRELPVDVVKMDRAFVAHLTSDPRAAVLARLVVDASHAMGMRVCAEGVETREQAGQLVELGCDLAQGWLFAPALALDDPRLPRVLAREPLGAPVGGLELEHVVSGADELVFTADRAGRVQFASAAAVRLLGVSPADMVGRPVTDYLRPVTADGAPGLPLGRGRVVATRRPTGERRWMDVTVRASQDGGREREMVVGVARDVTAVVVAEQQLERSERRFRKAFDEAPIGMAMTTLDGRFLRVNAAFAALLGRTPDDVLRRTVAELTVEEDRAADDLNVRELRRGHAHVHDVRKRYRHQDGRAVPVLVRAALVRGEDDEPPYVLAHVVPAAQEPPV